MLKICLAFWKCEPQYAYKRYAYKKGHVSDFQGFSRIPPIWISRLLGTEVSTHSWITRNRDTLEV